MDILVERRLAFGTIILKVFSTRHGQKTAQTFRKMEQPVTIFHGEEITGPAVELYLACRRRDQKWMSIKVHEIDSDAFYIAEQAKDVSKVLKPVYPPLGGRLQRNNRIYLAILGLRFLRVYQVLSRTLEREW
ncbi:MAG: DUF2179 domain-containing protein [Desulfocapsa sp.]|nr:DUF2179 domain-containing protein [Desulfocapsa sp.]